MNKEYDYFFKISIIGDTGTGKSNFLKRLSPTLTYAWDDTFKPTIGVEFSIFRSSVDQHKIKLLVWDNVGHSHHGRRIFPRFRDIHGILIVYDITNRKTFENVIDHIKEVKEYADRDVTMVLVGNKSDLEEKREVSYEEGRLLAEEYRMKFVEASVKKNENVNYLAKWLMKKGIEKEMEKGRIQEKCLVDSQKGKEFSFLSKCFSS